MPKYYEFEVSLEDIQPRIWRRFLLPANATFAHLHAAIQDSFGWENCHLFEFRSPGPRGRALAGIPTDEGFGPPTPDANRVKLDTYFTDQRAAARCQYVYDFGDDWAHDVKLMGLHSDKQSFRRRLLAGERSGPPEDCGGVPGYERLVHFVETGEDLSGDDPDDLRAWLGDWHPDTFDLPETQAAFDR